MRFEEEWENFEDFWENFGIRVGPFGIGMYGPKRQIRYSRTENSHIIRIRINSDIKKDEIKVRLVKPGLIEIEWPRRKRGEDIPVE